MPVRGHFDILASFAHGPMIFWGILGHMYEAVRATFTLDQLLNPSYSLVDPCTASETSLSSETSVSYCEMLAIVEDRASSDVLRWFPRADGHFESWPRLLPGRGNSRILVQPCIEFLWRNCLRPTSNSTVTTREKSFRRLVINKEISFRSFQYLFTIFSIPV